LLAVGQVKGCKRFDVVQLPFFGPVIPCHQRKEFAGNVLLKKLYRAADIANCRSGSVGRSNRPAQSCPHAFHDPKLKIDGSALGSAPTFCGANLFIFGPPLLFLALDFLSMFCVISTASFSLLLCRFLIMLFSIRGSRDGIVLCLHSFGAADGAGSVGVAFADVPVLAGKSCKVTREAQSFCISSSDDFEPSAAFTAVSNNSTEMSLMHAAAFPRSLLGVQVDISL